MTRLDIDWPDAAAERVRAARGRLVVAGTALRAMDLEERLQAVRRVLEAWTRPDSAWRRTLAAALPEPTGFHPATVAEGLESALRAWDPARFVAAARRELACVLDGEGLSLAPFDWSVVLAGGAIPMPTLLQSLLPLVLGTPVLLRETARDPVTGRCLARSLAEVAPSLAKAFESIAVPSGDRHGFDALLEAPCVVATGSDETMRSLAARIAPHQRFVAYGHRFSIGVVGPGPEALAPEAIEGFALDVARWDQSGCLSPVVLHLVGLEARARETFAHRLAEALDALGRQLPRGARSLEESALERRERSEARMRTASGAGLLIEGSDHTVVLEPDPTSRPAPLGRFVRLVPIASVAALDAALRPVSSHLATVAVVGFDAAADRELMEASSIRAASLVTRPGRLQTPPIDWPHDGRTLLQPLARFRQERSSPERFR